MTYTIILGMSILREINFTSPLPPPFLLDRDKRWSRLTREIFVLRPILIRDRRNCKMHFFVRSSGSSGGRPRALKLDRINNVYANWWSPVHGETFLHLKVYNVTRYIYIYTYITASEFFFVFSFFFFQEILRSAVERKDLFLLRILRDEYLKTPLSLSFLSYVENVRRKMIINSNKCKN